MKSVVRMLRRSGADVAFIDRALSSMRSEREEGEPDTAHADWSDDHMPDVVEFVDGNACLVLQTGGANA